MFRGASGRGTGWDGDEGGSHSFSHSLLDEFYWNFMNDRKKRARSIFGTTGRKLETETGSSPRAIAFESCAFQANRLSLRAVIMIVIVSG